MNDNQLIILLFGLIYFGFILYSRRKGDFAEFSVAGRSLGVFLIFSSICASYIGPAMTMGLSRDGFSNGLFSVYIATIGGIAMIFIGLFFAPKVRNKFTDSYSIGDILGGPSSHNHPSVKVAVGIVSVLVMSGITIVMSYAGGELINNIFGFSKALSIAIITGVVMLYSSFGGIRATIQTDAFQFVTFIILIPILAVLLLLDADFSWSEFSGFTAQSTALAFDTHTFSATLGLFLFWMISSAGLDAPILNRYMASRDAGVARKATVLGGLFTIIWIIIMVFIGSAGAFLHPGFADNDQVLLHIANLHFPGILYGIFIIAMIGVVMSTQDTTMNTASVIFGEDIMSGINPDLSDQQKLFFSKAFTFLLGGVSIVVAAYLDSVLHAIIFILSFYIPVMVPVTLFAVLKEKHHWQSAIVSMVVGFLAYLIWELFGSSAAPTLLVGVLSSTLAYWVMDQITKPSVSN